MSAWLDEKTVSWRLKVLLDAGYPLPLAEKLAERPDVDLHKAVDLVRVARCQPERAAEILL